jgi:protocatechuate 3,4-dioxygenase beta subunit
MSGNRIGRRHALGILGAGFGTALLAACTDDGGTGTATGGSTSMDGTSSTPTSGATSGGARTPTGFDDAATCTVTPEQTEGPYYLDVDQIRADVREDREGAELEIAVRVMDADGCTPIKDAVFDIWHADASGDYSGFDGSAASGASTTGSRYLRGAQITDSDGIATITTIFPGWYPGRTPHIHAKVFLSNAEVLTTQLYFDDTSTAEAYELAPYAQRGSADQSNRSDRIFDQRNVMTVSRDGDRFIARMTIAVQR